MHGDRDGIIPIALGQRAYAAAKAPKELYVVQGADHNDVPSVGASLFCHTVGVYCEVIGR